VDTLNVNSIRLLDNLKFRREAHFVENVFMKGVWASDYCYGLLASEFEDSQFEAPVAKRRKKAR